MSLTLGNSENPEIRKSEIFTAFFNLFNDENIHMLYKGSLEGIDELMFINIKEVLPGEKDVPVLMGQSRNNAKLYALELRDHRSVPQKINVVVKQLKYSKAEKEALAYSLLAGNSLVSTLIPLAIFSSSLDPQIVYHVTIADPKLVSLDRRIQAIYAKLVEENSRTIESAEDLFSRFGKYIIFYLKKSITLFDLLHSFDLLHGDAQPRNILENYFTGDFIICDFENTRYSKDIGAQNAETDLFIFEYLSNLEIFIDQLKMLNQNNSLVWDQFYKSIKDTF